MTSFRTQTHPPLVAHVIFRLSTGGLENGVINLLNNIPQERYRQALICLTDHDGFRSRILKPDVPVFALHKNEGHDVKIYSDLDRTFRQLRPAIVHTRSFATLDSQVSAFMASVPGRVHSEHGQESLTESTSVPRRRLLRRVLRPLIHHYIAVSRDIANLLIHQAGCPADTVTHVYNGVDPARFRPQFCPRRALGPWKALPKNAFVLGTVGRMEPVKDHLMLARAFVKLAKTVPQARNRLRLVIVGEGSMRRPVIELLAKEGLADISWLPGQRDDIPEIMRRFDVFVLPSRSEGTSNTILEAMATSLPVIATRVGGNPELVEDGTVGTLVPPADPSAMAVAIRTYIDHPERITRQSTASRKLAQSKFSLETMVNGYLAVYDRVLAKYA